MQPDLLAKRIRENLISQKKRLQDYLFVLESENKDIVNNDADRLLNHISLENTILEDLNSFMKILEPLEKMYDSLPYKKDNSLKDLKYSLDNLTKEVKVKSSKNQLILDNSLAKIKVDLHKIETKKRIFKSAYDTADTGFVDVSG